MKSIEAYLEEYGDILSSEELGIVDGFTQDEARWMWDEVSDHLKYSGVGGSDILLTNSIRKKWSSDGFSITSKFKAELSQGLNLALTIDNDAGERYPDSVVGYVSKGNWLIGDYSVSFGQGLVFWKGFSFSAFGEPSQTAKRAAGLKGYQSSAENGFLRGVAYHRRKENIEYTCFVSYDRIDAKVEGDRYVSLPETGIHVSESEVNNRNTLGEGVAGFNFTYSFGTWKIGLTSAAYAYDKHNGRSVRRDNELQMYDGLWGNTSISLYGSYGSLIVFSEAALDARFSPALIAGVLWSPEYGFETSASLYAFSPSYISSHSAEHTYNSIGANIAAKYLKGGLKCNFNAEYDFRPWYGYHKPPCETIIKARLSLNYSLPSGTSFLVQAKYDSTVRLRADLSFPAGPLTFTARAEWNPGGYGCYLESSYNSSRWKVALRGTYYDTKGWDSRIYFYEKGIPQSFGSQAYYGKGFGEYLVVKYSPNRILELYVKLQQSYCAFFTRIFIPG